MSRTPAYFLAAAGASVDAIVLVSSGVLTAAQTGNTILFAAALARGDLVTGLSAAISVLAFVVGTAVGALCLLRLSRGLRFTLAAEGLLLGVLLARALAPNALWGDGQVAIAAVAMGLQSACTRSQKIAFSTTYVTGVLANAVAACVERALSHPPHSPRGTSKYLEGVAAWGVYFGAALAAGSLYMVVGGWALVMPPVLLGLAAWQLKRPG